MRRPFRNLAATMLAALLVAYFVVSSSRAQNAADDTKNTAQLFHLRTVARPADPDPTTQSKPDRTQTLRKRISEAAELLNKADFKTFFHDYVDPFWLARATAGRAPGSSVEQFLTETVLSNPQQTRAMADAFASVLKKSLTKEPKWLLNGRAASFLEGRSSHTAEFWVYFDGKWRISPET